MSDETKRAAIDQFFRGERNRVGDYWDRGLSGDMVTYQLDALAAERDALREGLIANGCEIVDEAEDVATGDKSGPWVRNVRAESAEDALQWIARRGCENYVKPYTCRQDAGRSRDARYSADAWCDACVALAAIDQARQQGKKG